MADNYVVDDLAGFVVGARQDDLAGRPRALLKRNVLDSIACAVGSLDGEPTPTIREQTQQFTGRPTATLVAVAGRRWIRRHLSIWCRPLPDLLDTFLTVGGLCHPADNFGALLAVAEHVNASGRISCWPSRRLRDPMPVQRQLPAVARGLYHALQLAMSVAGGSAKLFGLDAEQTATAIAASAADNVSLAAVHAEPVSNWKGI